MARRVFITVAEVSGDQHAAAMVRCLRAIDPTLQIEGIGGPLMAAAGCALRYESVKNAAMGLAGATRYFELKKVFREIDRSFAHSRPDVWVGVDSPSMNLPFAQMAKGRHGIPTLQYVAPQLWAWREGRARKLRRWVDTMACILPFEEAYFRGLGVNATFVGHPLFDQVHASPPAASAARFPARPPVIGLLPGSRKSEAVGCFPAMLEVARQVRATYSGATFPIPTTAATDPIVRSMVGDANAAGPAAAGDAAGGLTIRQDAFDELVGGCDLCVVVSGTATLHVACHGVPMVTLYRGSRAAWHGLARWLVTTDTFALVNLLMPERRHVVREFIPWFGDPVPIVAEVMAMLADPPRLWAQSATLMDLVRGLDRPGASMRVAEMAMGLIRPRSANSGV